MLARVIGIGVETADMLVQEVLSRNLRDRRAVARYAGLTGSPDESGSKRREQGLSKAGNARVRRGLIQLAWRFLRFQKDSALAQWYRGRTEDVGGKRKRTMIVALARKLLIALWRLVTIGEIPVGVALRTVSLEPCDRTGAEIIPSFGILRALAQRSLIMIRDGGDPNTAMASKPSPEWARHLGASPLKRMVASWSGSDIGPNRIQGCGARDAPDSGLPSDRLDHRRTSHAIKLDTDIPYKAVL
jgi:hypothetical protein